MIPQELKYTKEHEWVKIEGDRAVMGISNYAQSQMGDIVYVELPEVGKPVSQFEKLGSLESVKTVSDFYAPLSGTVAEVNPFLLDRVNGNENADFHPEYVNKDPYGKGWIVKLKDIDTSGLGNLLSAAEYEKHLSLQP
jgi:glycine cleavage system H protein